MFLDDLYHMLDPVAFTLGPLTVRWYGIAYLLGFICAGIVMYRTARRWKLGLTADDVFSIVIGVVFGIIIGARLFYVVFYIWGAGLSLSSPLEIFATWEGGMSFHGGLVGAVVGGSLVCRHYGISVASVCDLGVIGAPLGLFFGRCANFVNGELWGKETVLPWGVMFETGGGVYRHPSQLYEAVLEGLVIFAVLYALSRRVPARPQGTFMGWFLTLYGVFRFLVEFVRVPDEQLGYLLGPITMGQLLSLPLVLLGVVVLVVAHRLGRPQVGFVERA